MDKFFRPSLTDLTRHAFKIEAKRIADERNTEADKGDAASGYDGAGDGVLPEPSGKDGAQTEAPVKAGETKAEETLTDLTLPPRVRIVKEWGEE